MQNINAEVRNVKYMHTLECSTSSKLCDSVIKPFLTTPMWTNTLARVDRT